MRKGILIGSGLILLFISVIFDRQVLAFIINHRTNFLTYSMHFTSFIGSALVVSIISTILFVYKKENRKYIPALWLTLFLTLGLVLILKYLIARPRPLVNALEIETDYSFPSGHAAAVFAPLILIDKLFPKIKWLWLGVGILVLFSRIYLGVHYMSDVIGGALLGYLIGIVVLRIANISF